MTILIASLWLLLPIGGDSSQHQALAKPAGEDAEPTELPPVTRLLLIGVRSGIAARRISQERAALDRFARRGRPLYCGGGSNGRYVALTFDDGPGEYTRLALEILERAQAKATFFLIGDKIRPWAGAAHAEAMTSAAIGIHAWTHISLTELDRAGVVGQIARTGTLISNVTGETPTLFRPTYGNHNELVDRIARQRGLVQVLWSIDSGDSQGKDWRGIGSEVLDNLEPGSIVLLHENRGQTIRALKYLILPGLEKRGYTTVTIPELLRLDPPPQHESRFRCWQRKNRPSPSADSNLLSSFRELMEAVAPAPAGSSRRSPGRSG